MAKRRNGSAIKRARRILLMREDPHCWYCGREVFEPPEGGGQTMEPDSATIEHLFGLHNGQRPQPPFHGKRVLAC